MKNHFMLSYFFNIIRTNLPNKSNKLFSHNTTAVILEALLGRGGVRGSWVVFQVRLFHSHVPVGI